VNRTPWLVEKQCAGIRHGRPARDPGWGLRVRLGRGPFSGGGSVSPWGRVSLGSFLPFSTLGTWLDLICGADSAHTLPSKHIATVEDLSLADALAAGTSRH